MGSQPGAQPYPSGPQGYPSAGAPYGPGGSAGPAGFAPIATPPKPKQPGMLFASFSLRDLLLWIAGLFALLSLVLPFRRFSVAGNAYYDGFSESTFMWHWNVVYLSAIVLGALPLIAAAVLSLLNKTAAGFPRRLGSLGIDQVISVLTSVSFAMNIIFLLTSAPYFHIGGFLLLLGSLVGFFAGVFTMIPFFAAEFQAREEAPAAPKARGFAAQPAAPGASAAPSGSYGPAAPAAPGGPAAPNGPGAQTPAGSGPNTPAPQAPGGGNEWGPSAPASQDAGVPAAGFPGAEGPADQQPEAEQASSAAPWGGIDEQASAEQTAPATDNGPDDAATSTEAEQPAGQQSAEQPAVTDDAADRPDPEATLAFNPLREDSASAADPGVTAAADSADRAEPGIGIKAQPTAAQQAAEASAGEPAAQASAADQGPATAQPAAGGQPFWFAVGTVRPAVDPGTGATVFMVTPGEWFLALEERQGSFLVQNNGDARTGVLRDLSDIQRA
ncbi:hypothetical protein NQ038_00925 [Brevibacterium sp. 50QC2O2]|uniref:hypothetical protein n=1 Tax=Brevibacterium sp. 50QC2O2 TaxID=2968459 RepID=UPI00211CE1B0|nr:hypothetical protein [Brevibacterium sp. 50QC2O2]MCQ9387219.1 hypothetical protein [Brevibacterium sp. 50QC2O2]